MGLFDGVLYTSEHSIEEGWITYKFPAITNMKGQIHFLKDESKVIEIMTELQKRRIQKLTILKHFGDSNKTRSIRNIEIAIEGLVRKGIVSKQSLNSNYVELADSWMY